MRIDLNYWEPVDWKREHTGSPAFKYVGAGVIIALLLVGWVSVKHSELSQVKKYLEDYKANAKVIEKETATTAKKLAYSKLIDAKVLQRVKKMNKSRMLWSRNLQVLPNIVTDEMLLSNVIVRSVRPKPSKADVAAAAKKGITLKPSLIYSIAIAGVVEGDMAQAEQAVEAFSYDLASERGFGTKLRSAELKGLGKSKDVKGVTFTVNGTFNGLK